MKARLSLLTIVFTLLFLALNFKIYDIQINKGNIYSAKAESFNRLSDSLNAVRGNIYFTDKNGNQVQVAINKEYPAIYAVPKEIKNPVEAAGELASVLSLDKTGLLSIFSKENDPYESLLKKADPQLVEESVNLGIKGIYINYETSRFYPFNNLAAQVLGFTAPNAEDSVLSGKYGIESYFNEELSGKSGIVKGDITERAQAGKDIRLNLDINVQTKAESILAAMLEQHSAEKGTIIVENPKTGKIIAMANYPSFDPNNYSESKLGNFINSAVQSIYEPGSVFKLITMSAGLDSNKLTPETTYYDKGSLTLNGRTIKNWDGKAHGLTTMTGVIEKSLNTGAAYAQKLIGKDLFYNYLVDFGLNTKTGIKLPGEVNGDIRKLKSSYKDIDFATASYGQGVAISPIQLISAVSAIANGGVLMKPLILAEEKPEIVRRVISEGAAKQVTEMMVSAVNKGINAKIANYNVAGKTGTAQVPNPKTGGYMEGVYIHSYVGFAPAADPQFVILIKLDKPQVTLAANTVTIPFRELSEYLINYYNIPPDNLAQ
ncbi:MAG: penicillin-binding protein 2 [Candidatus Pacebacteria bacterium]|nr:penicillin-binding protein 2 [Candidatus Paceibacterota bacterium]